VVVVGAALAAKRFLILISGNFGTGNLCALEPEKSPVRRFPVRG